MDTADHSADEICKCMRLKEFIVGELDKPCMHGGNSDETRRRRFTRLVAILQNMNAGKSGGGLSGAQATEGIWKELLKDINLSDQKFAFDPLEGDADFSFSRKPFSLKTLGSRNKNASLALAWSKNKPGAKKRSFESAMTILSFRPAAPNSRTPFWKTAQQGIYIIPLSDLKTVVKSFKRNNKTDTLIKSELVVKLMDRAIRSDLFIPLEVNPNLWLGAELSYWKAGDACLVNKS